MPGDPRLVWVGGVAILALPAEIDLSNAAQVRGDLGTAVAQGASLVIADMTATTFCDSAGVTALVRAVRTANEGGTRLRVAAAGPTVTRVLAITGVDRLIDIYPSVAAAMAAPRADAAGRDRAAGQDRAAERDRAAGQDRAARPGPAGPADPGGRAPQPG